MSRSEGFALPIKPLHAIEFKKVDKDRFIFSTSKYADFYEATGDRLGIFISEKTKQVFENLALPLVFDEEL